MKTYKKEISDLPLEKLEFIKKISYAYNIETYFSQTKIKSFKEYIPFFKKIVILLSKRIINVCKRDIPHVLNKKSLPSIIICWIGLQLWKCILYYNDMIPSIKITRRDELIILLYIASDYILDEANITYEEKLDMVKYVNDRFSNKSDIKNKSKYNNVNVLLGILDETLQISPNSTLSLKEAWKAETYCSKDYLFNSVYKGWKTVSMASSILTNGKDFIGSLELGASSQLIDDLMDWEIDIKDDIETCCVEYIKQNLYDEYIFICFKCIDNIPNIFLIVKVMFIISVCSCGYHNKHCSNELKNILSKNLIYREKINIEEVINNMFSY